MAPRRRKNPADLWLPERVYRGKTSYEYRTRLGKTIRLARIQRDKSGALLETDQIKRAVIQAKTAADTNLIQREDMNWLFGLYTDSLQFRQLAVKTQKDDLLRLKRLTAVFGAMMPNKVTSGHIRQYMDKLGAQKPVSANRDHGFLSRVFSWAKERNYVRDNPVRDVKKFKEQPRDRYIEDWEYWLVYEVALRSSYPWVAPMMEIAYLCRMRSQEVRSVLEDRHLLEDGLFVERGKGSANEITQWSERLKKAVSDARDFCRKGPTRTEDRPLFKAKSGGVIPKTAFDSAWRRVRSIAMTDGLEIDGQIVKLLDSFNFHDIKAKGITDHELKASGHRNKKMLAVYDRKPEIVKATR